MMDQILINDAAKTDPKTDNLDRKFFSEKVAESIINLNTETGFVYAIYGPCGSGKSTTINFIEYYINKNKEKAKIIIFKFNPWMFSNAENLMKIFLEQLRIRLSMDDIGLELSKISKNLEKIESIVSISSPLLKILMPGAGVALDATSNMLSGGKKALDLASENSKKDLEQIKKDITENLSRQEQRIVIIIDDLDRLYKEEIKTLIRVIKAVCDFPKIIYLIACDSDIIANALHDESGLDYLEKIVQCSFMLPMARKSDLGQMLDEGLNKLINLKSIPNHLFQENDYINLYQQGINLLIETPRQVKVLLNSINAHYSGLKENVNFSDFIGIHVIKVFFPQIYRVLDSRTKCNGVH